MSKIVSINISLEEDYLKRFDRIVKKEYTDRSKLVRKWIDQNYKEVDDSTKTWMEIP